MNTLLEHKIHFNSDWLGRNGKPLIIAGPCSAESEEQVLQTARKLAKIHQITILRAGIWKPRTRPNGFEGIGIQGMQWLKKVKEETGLKIAIEVANAHHVYEALKHGIDVLWIGARTTVNPFSVQEIAIALQGVDVPVFVKNPINPDLQVWIGALERLAQVGVRRLGAIHRGFSTFEKTPYRNAPKWEIPIELKRLVPEIPLICDPSHISGNRELIFEVSQKALDLAMHGLMIESHIDPENALSDSKQQVRPEALKNILNKLKFRRPSGNTAEPEEILKMLRREIDVTDNQLIELISRRTEISRKIGQYKKDNNMTILQVNRWQQLLDDRLKHATRLGLDEDFVKDIYQILHNKSIKIQSELMNQPMEMSKNNGANKKKKVTADISKN